MAKSNLAADGMVPGIGDRAAGGKRDLDQVSPVDPVRIRLAVIESKGAVIRQHDALNHHDVLVRFNVMSVINREVMREDMNAGDAYLEVVGRAVRSRHLPQERP